MIIKMSCLLLGILFVRRLALTLDAFEEAGHEELLRERCQAHAAGLAVVHEFRRVLRIDDLEHGVRGHRDDGEVDAALLETAQQLAADMLSNGVIEDVISVHVSGSAADGVGEGVAGETR